MVSDVSPIIFPVPPFDELQKILAKHEKQQAFTKMYMRQYRQDHKEEIKQYKKELREKKKLENPESIRKRGRPKKVQPIEEQEKKN